MPKIKEITITVQQARDLQALGVDIRGAVLAHTMGPNWRDIVWITSTLGKRPNVSNTHTHAKIKKLLGADAPEVSIKVIER